VAVQKNLSSLSQAPDIVPQKDDNMIRVPTDRSPTHPGEMLLEEFLAPMGLTQRELADAIHVPYQRINEIINGRRGITPGTALRLAKFFGMSADFWMNIQLRWDLYRAQQSERDALKAIRRHTQASAG
jgi:addiction module HigA family antidote